MRRGEDGLGIDSRLPVGRNAGLAARAPGPILWLKFGFGSEAMGVLPPWLKFERPPAFGVAGPPFLTAFSTGRKMPEPGIVVLK